MARARARRCVRSDPGRRHRVRPNPRSPARAARITLTLAADARRWYATLAGRRTARRLARLVEPAIRLGPTARLLALGYAPPLLAGLDPRRLERLALVIAPPHAPHRWPSRGPGRALAAIPDRLPFAAGLFDQALLVHGLEHAPDARAILRELWRVLAPAGEIVVIVPNRLGRWLAPASPFALGRAWGRAGLDSLLRDAMFEPRAQRTALGLPGGAGRVRLVIAAKVDGFAPALSGRAAAFRAARPAL